MASINTKTISEFKTKLSGGGARPNLFEVELTFPSIVGVQDENEVIENSSADVFIALAGLSAALPGVVAAHTLKPVIGVPCASSSSPANLDSLLSVVQMPPGVPVAGVGIG